MKAPFVTISVAAATAALIACGGKVNGVPGTTSGPDGTEGDRVSTNPPPPEPTTTTNPPSLPSQPCPSEEVREGAACASGFGQPHTCAYVDRCESRPKTAPPTRQYDCSGGKWVLSRSYLAECPIAPPSTGDSCASCANDYPAECRYGNDSGCPPTIAACDPLTLTWNVSVSTCNPPPPPQDGGAGAP